LEEQDLACKRASNQKKDIKLPTTNSRCKITQKKKNKKIEHNIPQKKKNYKKNKEIEQKMQKRKGKKHTWSS
jgi:hypothetical protein